MSRKKKYRIVRVVKLDHLMDELTTCYEVHILSGVFWKRWKPVKDREVSSGGFLSPRAFLTVDKAAEYLRNLESGKIPYGRVETVEEEGSIRA